MPRKSKHSESLALDKSCLALTIDALLERHQVLVRPLGQWSETQDAVGCALLGEGEVGVVLKVK